MANWQTPASSLVCATVLGLLLVLVRAESVHAQVPDAYADAGTRALVEAAGQRRNVRDASILRYRAIAQERMSAGLRLVARERLMFRRETAVRIDWSREGLVRIDVLGAREAIPPVLEGVQLPAALTDQVAHLAFDPTGSEMLVRLDTSVVRHPLDPGAEQHYRFRSGDTTTIRLPDGHEVRLLELVIEPRRRDADLIAGSFWIDADTYGVVRMVFRLARPREFAEDAPGWLSPRAELAFVTVEYGLWDLRWWMPRLVRAEGAIELGSFLRMPLAYERRYSEYEIEGDTVVTPVVVSDSARLRLRRCRPPFEITVAVGEDRERAEARARERLARLDSLRAERGLPVDTLEGDVVSRRCGRVYLVETSPDTAALLASAYLPPSIWQGDAGFFTEAELADLEARLEQLPEAPWQLAVPRIRLPFAGGGVRYNRVEGLSLAARGALDLGRIQLDASARMGTADRVLNGELGITRETRRRTMRLAAYRRLEAADPPRPFSLGKSLGAFLLGSDDGQYYRAHGAELAIRPSLHERPWYDLKLFAERQSAARVETDFSIAHLLDDDRVFRGNIEAADADQAGVRIALRAERGQNPAAPRWNAQLDIEASTGTFDFVRPMLELRGDAPLPGGATGALEFAAGRAWGTIPVQSFFYLGGTPTLRGYRPVTSSGDAFWRARVELATRGPAARLIAFCDAGWAGPRDRLADGRALLSAGLGASLLNGLFRADYARALRAPTGWRFHLYTSAAL